MLKMPPTGATAASAFSERDITKLQLPERQLAASVWQNNEAWCRTVPRLFVALRVEAVEDVRYVAVAVPLLRHQEIAPAVEIRIDVGVRRQVVIGLRRRIVARFIGIVRIDRDRRRAARRSALQLECALAHEPAIFVPGHAHQPREQWPTLTN